jgi:phosphotriesterase-related protein
MSQSVHTVRGEVDVDALGTVLMHEHVFVLSEEFRLNYPEYWDEDERVADAVRKLRTLAERGVDTIVDPTVLGLGRDLARVRRVNEQVDINIVAATGLYTYGDLPFFLHHRGPGTTFGGDEPMVEMFTRDLEEGIADTGIRAAFLKCAIEDELTPGVERVMRAVAQTHLRTGAPITVHTNAKRGTGLVAQRVLREEGVDLRHVVLGHSGDTNDLDYLVALLEAGSILGMDRFGLDLMLPFEERVATVAELCRRGYVDQLVLAHDASCYIDWFSVEAREAAAPNWHYTHVHDDVLPALRNQGVTEQQITAMMQGNPRRYFTRP